MDENFYGNILNIIKICIGVSFQVIPVRQNLVLDLDDKNLTLYLMSDVEFLYNYYLK